MSRIRTNRRLVLFASCADNGTASITSHYKVALEPDVTVELRRGFRRMGPASLLSSLRLLNSWKRERARVICLFNAPILLGGLVARGHLDDWRGILDWTEAFPSRKTGALMNLYNRVYVASFRSLGSTHSPSPDFRKYYNSEGASIRPTMYPLPSRLSADHVLPVPKRPRVLFVGGDYRRKGGDLLLRYWAEQNPNAQLTFVSKNAPTADIHSVVFERNIEAGSVSHASLFRHHDILVLPTFNEPFGYVVLEALCQGLGVITTNCAGSSSIVRESGGIVAQSPDEAIRRLHELLPRSDLLLRIKQQCFRHLPLLAARTQAALDDLVRP